MTDALPHALPPPGHAAIFLDFDGTLVDLAPRPNAVAVPPALIRLLPRLRLACNGALAIVSGRSLADLDRLLAPLRLTVVAEHGAEIRLADGTLDTVPMDAAIRTMLQLELAAMVEADPRLLLEDKAVGIAVHYRAAPELKPQVEARMAALIAMTGGHFELQRGKMVAEARPRGVNKGEAILRLLDDAPFAGRTSIFAGDDITDEMGFAVVEALGGHTIKVGEGDSRARYRVGDVAGMIALLERYAGGIGVVA